MLRSQKKAAVFSGGIEADRITPKFAEKLRGVRIHSLFLACDTDGAIKPLRKAIQTLGLDQNKLYCYVLIGRETIEQATARLEAVYEAGCIPFAQLFQPADHWINYSREWKQLARSWSRPAIIKTMHNFKER
jgi:hypothetical protein